MQRIVFLIFLLQAYSTVIAVEQEGWEWTIQNLQKGAERSRTGNQVGAALRVAEDRAGDPAFASSPAGQYLERAKAGDVGVMKDMEWINMMTASGIPTQSAAVGLRQKSSNIAVMTPGLAIAVMGTQWKAGAEPRLKELWDAHVRAGGTDDFVWKGKRDRFAQDWNYKSYAHMEQVQGMIAGLCTAVDAIRPPPEMQRQFEAKGVTFDTIGYDILPNAQSNWMQVVITTRMNVPGGAPVVAKNEITVVNTNGTWQVQSQKTVR
jgi:hypothetical protein